MTHRDSVADLVTHSDSASYRPSDMVSHQVLLSTHGDSATDLVTHSDSATDLVTQ